MVGKERQLTFMGWLMCTRCWAGVSPAPLEETGTTFSFSAKEGSDGMQEATGVSPSRDC